MEKSIIMRGRNTHNTAILHIEMRHTQMGTVMAQSIGAYLTVLSNKHHNLNMYVADYIQMYGRRAMPSMWGEMR